MSTRLYIKLFGDLCLTANKIPITGMNSERLQALLAFILLHRDAPQSRQQIAVQLWPDATEADAKANLRRRLHELKQLIPEADRWLRIETKTVQWVQDKDCRFDVAQFEAAIAPTQPTQHALEQAVKLYQGDLLPGCYDDWIVPYRNQIRQQAIATLETLITLLASQNTPRPAISYAQQLQRLDPLYEPVYCHLMRLHAQEGDRASALRVYHQLMTVLREELGVNPSPTTCKPYEDLLPLEDASTPPSCEVIAQPLSLTATWLPEATPILNSSAPLICL